MSTAASSPATSAKTIKRAAAACAGGRVRLGGVDWRHLATVLSVLHQAGCRVESKLEYVELERDRDTPLKGVPTIRTAPYPGFPTDAQAILMAALAGGEGATLFEENILDSRYRHVDELRRMGAMGEMINLNINYLLFQLIHVATKQDDCVNQEEILHLISESAFEDGAMRGSKIHLARFACEYAEYLAQLRTNVSRGVLAMIEQEAKARFAENLTLRDLGQKYFINNAYLGQVFRKKYNQSFKDYLNNYRIEQAAQMLLRTDDKIYKIAEDVGYKNTDYFINKFIAAKGCTPSKFRKQSLSIAKSID